MHDDSEDLSGSEDDFDEDSESESEGEAGVVHRKGIIAKLEAEARDTPYSSEVHVALISSLREAAKLSRLREVRMSASSLVSLPESVWVEWLQDETNLAEEDDFDQLDDLYKRACEAHPLSSKIWLARCTQHRERAEAAGGGRESHDGARAVYEEALEVVGLHPTEGPEVWADYRMFEESVLATSKGEESVAQAQRLRMLFFRQLALPMPGIERLQEAHKTFESSLEPAARQVMSLEKAAAIAEEAADSWQEREALEGKLLEASRPMLTVSLTAAGAEDTAGPSAMANTSAQLLAMDEATGDPARILLGHLRATAAAPSEAPRWLALASFLEDTVADLEKATSALERAVRSQPHSAALWVRLLVCREAAGASLADLGSIARRGVPALKSAIEGSSAELLEFLFHHADACRRLAVATQQRTKAAPPQLNSGEAWSEMRSVFEQAVKVAEASDAEPGSNCQVLLRWMRLEAYVARDLERALSIGNRLLEFWGAYYNGWSAFIAAVRFCCGSDSYATVSKLYRSALTQVADYPSQIQSDYLEFERECGTLHSWRAAQRDSARRAQQEAAASELQEKEGKPQQVTGRLSTEAAPQAGEVPAPVSKRPISADAAEGEGEAAEGEATAAQQRPSKRQKKREKQLAARQQKEQQKKENGTAEATAAPVAGPPVQALVPETAAKEPKPTVESPSAQQALVPETAAKEPKPTVESPSAQQATVSEAAAKEAKPTVKSPSAQQATVSEKEANPTVESPSAQQEPKPTVESPSAQQAAEPKTAAREPTPDVTAPSEQASALQTAAAEPTPEIAEPGVQAPAQEAPVKEPQPDATKPTTEADSAAPAPDGTESGRSGSEQQADVAATTGAAEAAAAASKGVVPRTGAHFHQRQLPKDGKAAGAPAPEAEGQRTIFVSNLDWSVGEATLYRLFQEIDGLKEVRLVKDFLSRSKGYAYIDFATSDAVAAAVEKFNGHLVNKRPLRVARSLPTKALYEEKTAFVAQLAAAAKEEDIRTAFASHGEIEAVRVPHDPSTGSHKGYAYVEFKEASSLESALNAESPLIAGQQTRVARSIPMKDHRHTKAAPRKDLPQRLNQKQVIRDKELREDPVKQAEKHPTTVYVKNLAFDVDDEKLKAHFGSCGKIEQTLICRNANGRSRGFGFLEFESPEHAQAALLMSDTELLGRAIVVSRSQRAITQKKSFPAEGDASVKVTSTSATSGGTFSAVPPPSKKRKLLGVDAGDKLVSDTASVGSEESAKAKAHVAFRTQAKAVGAASEGTSQRPMSNADFRKLLLSG